MSTTEQMQKMKNQPGFVAALDQNGGQTPHARAAYGIKDHSWNDDDEMFELVHQMRARVITSPSFTGKRILAAILFEDTMDRDIEGQPTTDYRNAANHAGRQYIRSDARHANPVR